MKALQEKEQHRRLPPGTLVVGTHPFEGQQKTVCYMHYTLDINTTTTAAAATTTTTNTNNNNTNNNNNNLQDLSFGVYEEMTILNPLPVSSRNLFHC